jgi:hypothetical protein
MKQNDMHIDHTYFRRKITIGDRPDVDALRTLRGVARWPVAEEAAPK